MLISHVDKKTKHTLNIVRKGNRISIAMSAPDNNFAVVDLNAKQTAQLMKGLSLII
jgi:hypothetical protein